MSVIHGKILSSRETFENEVLSIGDHPNYGEFVLSFLNGLDDLNKPWIVNAGFDLTGINRSGSGKVLRRFSEVEPYSRDMASHLRNLGVAQGSVVLMFVPNNTDFHFLAIGTWLCRAIISLSDPYLNSDTLVQQIAETRAKVIICNEMTRSKVMAAIKSSDDDIAIGEIVPLEDTKLTAVQLIRRDDELIQEPENKAKPSHPFKPFEMSDGLVIFWTSGTTGKPKGILHTATYLTNMFMSKSLSFKLCDVTFSTCFFHTSGFLSPIMQLMRRPSGRLQFFTSEDLVEDIGLLFKSCDAYPNTNGLFCASNHLVRLACTEPPLGPEGRPLDLSHVMVAMPMGTFAPSNLFKDLKKKFSNLLVVPNFYGLTEFGRTICHSRETSVLGVVGPGVEVKIVDIDTQEALGPNQVGEIMARCDIVMEGYLDRPEETAIFFGEDGFIHTGDLARYDENGILYYEGRLKEVIQYNGHLVFTRNIEQTIEELPDVIEATVFGRPDPLVKELVAAAVVLFPDSKLTPEDIVRHTDSRISDDNKRLRGGVFVLENLPRNIHGKIQRNKILELIKKT